MTRMRTKNVQIPPELDDRLTQLCEEHGFNRSKMIRKGIEWVVESLTTRYGTSAANAPTAPLAAPAGPATVAPTPAPTPAPADAPEPEMYRAAPAAPAGDPTYANPFHLAPTLIDGEVLFQLDAVLRSFGVTRDELAAEVDLDDEIVNHADVEWVGDSVLVEARTLSIDPELADRAYTWCEHQARRMMRSAA